MVCVDTLNYGKAVSAIRHSLDQIEPARTIFFTDIVIHDSFEVIKIDTIRSKDEYSHFIVKKLAPYIKTEFVLIIQADGYVLDGSAWTDEFLQYDYIGATWQYQDGRNVGNGGFSLRSLKLHQILHEDDFIKHIYPEDEAIGRLYRGYLEKTYGIKFAPEALANRFSFECNEPKQSTLGFHGIFWSKYLPQVVLKREAAMGDIIMMEPIMEHFYKKGYQVILDVPVLFFQLFDRHYFPVYHSSQVHAPNARVINLDMAYEARPKQLALKSYYEMCGIEDGEFRNPKLSNQVGPHNKLFDKYAVFHIDDTAMTHRDIHGVDWDEVSLWLATLGYTVIQVGKGEHRIGIKMNSASQNMLAYIIAGADLFVGIDSGPGQISVACGVKSVLFFGSVNPKYRYADFSKIQVIQNPCEFAGCYHEVISVNGQDCKFDVKQPPCTVHNHEKVIEAIKKLI